MSTSPTRDRVSSVAESIVAYLDVHPNAADTAQGIRDAWLNGAASLAEVDEALAALVARGRLVSRPLPDSSALFASADRQEE